ncbi:GNAT family N-acetyltransferase [Pedobacter cryoconitis]|uniref:Ribosomal protein S18 acetylase RimI-like enzyme n=1 Tax=Pedobacter cryoconitis TaxID=188932 RepID=A0A7X0IYN8_9SPHI|nr:GNAT family N-acetyltransferase [Pedobacter cryoconitis]MBB6497879.1 ribosomal protein S18 acetylase RimI-like enzyme [Pedobacter cryoconitis]
MIRRISAEQTLPLRSAVLRNNMSFAQCVFPTDDIAGVFHLGYFVNEELVCIGTFFPEDYKEMGPGGFRLRGMATDPAYAGKGFGGELIKFCFNELRSVQAAYIWCNARSAAVGFYNRLGFEVISEEFEIHGVGPHYDMYYQLN